MCVGKDLVRVTSRSFPLAATTIADAQTFRPRNFFGPHLFSFLNKGQFSTFLPQSAGVFLKMRYELGKFRAKGVKNVR